MLRSAVVISSALAVTACAPPHAPTGNTPVVSVAPLASATASASAAPSVASSATPPPDAGVASIAATEPKSEPELAPYTTPLLDAPTLDRVARETCERSRTSGRPILVEFSADWCADCRKLAAIKTHAPLEEELSNWEPLSINVGDDGFQHPELMRAFRVDAIAKLVALRPKNCALPLRFWKPLAMRTLSGLTRPEQLNAGLAEWLATQRSR